MYLLFFTLFGIFVPFVARFLTANGLTEQETSVIMAVVNGVNMFAPFLFSYLADKTGRRVVFIRVGFLAIGVFYLLSLFAEGFWQYLIIFGLFGVFLSAVLPQMESVTLAILGKERSRYGQIRFWGSIGFVLVVWLMGRLLDLYTVNILPIAGSIITLLMFLSTFLIPERPKSARNSHDPIQSTASNEFPIQWSQVIVLLTAVLFWQIGMAPYNTFFDIYLKGHGFSATTNGFLISFGSFSEIVIFIFVARMFLHFSERFLMSFALAFTVLRWFLLYKYADSFVIILFSQALHALTFGLVHSVAVHRIAHLFPESRASFGQGLYVALGTGLGLFSGNLLAGFLWNGSGFVYLQAAGWTLLALAITWFGFRDSENKQP
jgi:PPP family 3-phenylpropionic acid transporter